MKVLFLTNVPSPYRVDFFNELGKYCDLTVVFEKKTSDERDASWRNYQFKTFTGIFLKGISIGPDMAICGGVKKIIKNGQFDKIVCANFTSPTGMIAISYLRRKKIPYWLESDGGFAKNGRGLKERIKKHFIRGAEGYFSSAQKHDEYYMAYGASSDKIYRYPFTSLLERDILREPVSVEEKNNLKCNLGMKEDYIILAVGQFIHRKGFDLLLRATSEMSFNVGVYFVGGIPTKEYVQTQMEKGLINVHFEGFKTKQELKKYYQAADLFVLPTREDIWGLVINEAMANALPVVTTDKCIAGLELIENSGAGRIIPSENVDELTAAINNILANKAVLQDMRVKCIKKISGYTIENMALRHIDLLSKE